MDCIDCHNRPTHIYNSPNDLIDTSMSNGNIDHSLPYIKKEGLSALDPQNSSLDAANLKIDAIRDYYKRLIPRYFRIKGRAIDNAVKELKNIAVLTTFPDMKVTWNSYPKQCRAYQFARLLPLPWQTGGNNGDQKGQTVSADCQLCHYLDISQAFPK